MVRRRQGFRCVQVDDASRHSFAKVGGLRESKDAFPGVDLAGGICYFLWDKDNNGLCEVVNGAEKLSQPPAERKLDEFSTFVRHSAAVPIIRKVISKSNDRMSAQVSSRKPFGLPTNARPDTGGDLILRWEKGEGPFRRENLSVGLDLVDKWKVISSYVAYDHAGNPGIDGRRKVFSKIGLMPPGTICTETYLVIGAFATEDEARNLIEYMKSRFFRFLVSQLMYSHHLTKAAYEFVPALDMTQKWTDEKLFEYFDLSESETQYIAVKIRPFDGQKAPRR